MIIFHRQYLYLLSGLLKVIISYFFGVGFLFAGLLMLYICTSKSWIVLTVNKVRGLTDVATLIFISRLLLFRYFTQEERCLDTCSLYQDKREKPTPRVQLVLWLFQHFFWRKQSVIFTRIGSCSWIHAWPLLYT